MGNIVYVEINIIVTGIISAVSQHYCPGMCISHDPILIILSGAKWPASVNKKTDKQLSRGPMGTDADHFRAEGQGVFEHAVESSLSPRSLNTGKQMARFVALCYNAHVSSANLLKYVYSDLLVLRTVGRPMKSQKTGFSYLFCVWQLCILYVYHTHGGFLQLFHFLQLKCGFITSALQMTSSFIQLFPSLEVSRDIKWLFFSSIQGSNRGRKATAQAGVWCLKRGFGDWNDGLCFK